VFIKWKLYPIIITEDAFDIQYQFFNPLLSLVLRQQLKRACFQNLLYFLITTIK